jgi:CheY-like chemotaxis protein
MAIASRSRDWPHVLTTVPEMVEPEARPTPCAVAAGACPGGGAGAWIQPAPTNRPGPADPRPARILLVDDDADVLAILKEYIESIGAAVLAARSADVALVLARTVRIDLLVSDLAMPDHDGLWLARHVRRVQPRTPAIAVTAYLERFGREAVRQAGFTEVLTKPVHLEDLCTTVTRSLAPPPAPRVGRPRSVTTDARCPRCRSRSVEIVQSQASAWVAACLDCALPFFLLR